MRKVEKSQQSLVGTIAAHTIYSVVATLLSLLLVFLFSVLISTEILPESFAKFACVVSLFIASLISGGLIAKVHGHALFTSFCQGVFNVVICYVMGMIIFLRIIPQNFDVHCLIAGMVGSVVGGDISAMATPKRHKIKNKQRRM